jgi:hypothetical protein
MRFEDNDCICGTVGQHAPKSDGIVNSKAAKWYTIHTAISGEGYQRGYSLLTCKFDKQLLKISTHSPRLQEPTLQNSQMYGTF